MSRSVDAGSRLCQVTTYQTDALVTEKKCSITATSQYTFLAGARSLQLAPWVRSFTSRKRAVMCPANLHYDNEVSPALPNDTLSKIATLDLRTACFVMLP